MQIESFPTPRPETLPPSGGVFAHNHNDFATFSEHQAVPAEWTEVINDKAVTPPELTKENGVSLFDPLFKNEIQWQLEAQMLPIQPASTAPSMPMVASTPLDPILSGEKTRR